ncbi:autotransporter-associated beta strand repeat-containing protein, partial [Salmonella enterica]|uniref:autotransporter-associated beta strand repeat-containing protein n=1 Tax=Salmonella enterica TaxID=28901 RepID=UPI001E28E9F0
TLSGSNTYTGGTLISDGTLVASNVDALGSGDVTDNATLELNTGGGFVKALG